MKRINFWALLASGLIGLPVVAFAQDDAKKPETNQSEELFKKLDKNGDGKLVPDEIPEEQGRFFDRLVRLGDKDDNGELTKAEFDAAIKRSDAPVQGGGFGGGGQGGPGGGRPMIDFKQMLERLDKNKDGKLSKDEIPEDGPARFLREMMTRQNKDSLTAEDFEQMRQRGAGGGPGGFGGPGEFLKRLDKNNDGKLQKDELPEGLRDRLAKVFEKLGKSELTQEEFGRAMAEFGPPPGAPGAGAPGGRPNQNPEEQFKRMDANGDGKVTLDEVPEQFRDRVRPMFERAKKDVLTLEDVVAFNQAREGERRPAEGGRGDAARKPDGEARKTEGDARKPDGEARRNAGDRPDARKPEGDRKPDGDRKPEAGRDGDRRPPEGGRPPEGDRRGPGGDAPRGPADGRGPGDGPRRGQLPRFFEILDTNHDGKISRDELNRLKEVFAELDRNKDGQLDPAELLGPPPGQEGRGPGPDGNRPPEGRGPGGQPPRDGDRRPPEGDRPRDGERKPEGDRPRDGARKPEGDRPRDGDARPDQRKEGRPPRREDKEDKPRDKEESK